MAITFLTNEDKEELLERMDALEQGGGSDSGQNSADTLEGILTGEYTAAPLLEGVPVYGGYLGGDGAVQDITWAAYATVYTDTFAVTEGDVLSIEYKQPLVEAVRGSLMWRAYGLYDANGNWISRFGGAVTGVAQDGYHIYKEEYTVPAGVSSMCVMCRTNINDNSNPVTVWGGDGTPPQDVLDGIFTIYRKSEIHYIEMEKRLLPLL